MQKNDRKTAGKIILAIAFLMGAGIFPGSLRAQTTATIVDKGEIRKAYSQILEVNLFVENLIKKADEKKDLVAKDCLLPLLTSAQKSLPDAEKAKTQAENGIDKNDFVAAGKGIETLAVLREYYKNLFGEALACLSKEGAKKDWKQEIVNLIKPLVNFTEEELLALPEPSLEPNPWLSIYR